VSSRELASRIAAIADGKQASDIVALDVSGLVGYTDVLVICTARNERLAKAIGDEVYEQLKHGPERLLPARSEGVGENRWILLDYVDCVLHVFVPETRERYRLEQLWGEAEQLDLDIAEPGGAVRRPA
jgi:ribosome-associated protein